MVPRVYGDCSGGLASAHNPLTLLLGWPLDYKKVSEAKGLVAGNPFTFSTICPACAAPFTSTFCWFYVSPCARGEAILSLPCGPSLSHATRGPQLSLSQDCHVTIDQSDGKKLEFEARGSDMRVITLDSQGVGGCVHLAVTE